MRVIFSTTFSGNLHVLTPPLALLLMLRTLSLDEIEPLVVDDTR
jgi:hypothetical protein